MSGARISVLSMMSVFMTVSAASAAELQPAADGAPFRLGGCEVTVTNVPARKLTRVPVVKSDRPLYLVIPLGSGENAVIAGLLDESQGTGKGYDQLRVDANGNGDLTDDPVIGMTMARAGTVTSLEAEPFDLAVSYAGNERRTLQVRLAMRGYPEPLSKAMAWSASCYVNQHMEGRVDIGARRNVLIGLYDSSRGPIAANGCFNDYGADRLRIDLNKEPLPGFVWVAPICSGRASSSIFKGFSAMSFIRSRLLRHMARTPCPPSDRNIWYPPTQNPEAPTKTGG